MKRTAKKGICRENVKSGYEKWNRCVEYLDDKECDDSFK